jgi:hypothetical protein
MATSQGGSITILDAPWHPTITLAMVQQYDPGITALNQCVVLPDSWTGPAPGPPAGTGIPGSGVITLVAGAAAPQSAVEHSPLEPEPEPEPPASTSSKHGKSSSHR